MLQRKIMFKQLEELQKQQKLQESNVINQQSLIQNNYAPLTNGTPVRDPSQTFMFGNTNMVHGFQNGLTYSTDLITHEFGKTGQQQELTKLDPLEQKFLLYDDSLGVFGNMFEETDNLQSGSWSALMHSALEETSSTDTGMQEEWSGLSFQNPEPSNDYKHPSNLMEIGENTNAWQNNIFQNLSSLNSRPDATAQVQRLSPLQVHQAENVLLSKGFLTNHQRRSKASEVTTFKNSDSSGTSAIVDFPSLDSNGQISHHMVELLHKVDKFREYKHGTLTLRPPVNYCDLSQISRQADTCRLVPLKYKDGQRLLIIEGQQVSNPTRQPNVWVDVANIKMETALEHVTGGIDLLVKKSSHTPLLEASQLHRNTSFVQMNLAVNKDLLVSQSKKRKFTTYELLPWHKEAIKGSSRLQDMSIAQLEWAQATNRVPEKLKEETEAFVDQPMIHSKKRIILATQLMQLLFRPAPAACYNTLTYFAARLALGDACSLTNHSHAPCDISHSSSRENVISKGRGDQNLAKIVKDFTNRVKKLEDKLLRLENGGSVLKIKMESRDLERFSVINRLAKFHSRTQMVAAETGFAGGGSTVVKLYPQRYVTASQMPRIVPEGHNCLLL